MESLNSYISDGESDSSANMMIRKKTYSSPEEIDANCEPITMDMSEDSSNGHSDPDKNGKYEKRDRPKRYYSRSLSPSPPTSYSSRDSSPDRKKSRNDDGDRYIRSSSERSKSDSVKGKRYDEDIKKYDRISRRDDYRDSKDHRHRREDKGRRDDDRHRRDHRDRASRDDKFRDRRRDKEREYNTYDSKRYDKKRPYPSRSRSRSHSRHSRTSSHKRRTRSRSRSYDRHRYSPRRSNSKRNSPMRSRRSRSKSRSGEKPRSYDWKSNSKLKVLEKLGIEIKVPPGGIDISQTGVVSSAATSSNTLTPQLLLQKTMEQQVEKVKSATGIELPSYYNPIAVNPSKYAEQIQKRRLLWGNKDKQPSQPQAKPSIVPSEEIVSSSCSSSSSIAAENKNSSTIWQGATFGGDQDGKMTAKFKRLMGIKNAGQDVRDEKEASKEDGSDLIKKQEEMFNSMESQYEVARLATHSHRGLGLGFGTFQPR